MFDFLSIYYTTAYANPWFHKNEKKNTSNIERSNIYGNQELRITNKHA